MTQYPAYNNYKEIENQWFPSLPEAWSTNRLKYLASVNDDVLSECTDPDYELEYVDIGGVSHDNGIETAERFQFKNAPSRARRLVKSGDIVISTVRTYLKAIASIDREHEHLVFSTGFAVIRPQSDFHACYSRWILQSEEFIASVVANSNGVNYPAITASTLANRSVPTPPLPEQRTIADFLDYETARIDKLIEKQQRLIELLDEKRQGVISHAVTKGLNPDAPMKDSGIEWLGKVPKHWQLVPFKQAIDFKEGPGILAKDFQEEGIPLIRIRNLTDGYVDIDGCNWLDPRDVRRKWKHFAVKNGDLLISASASTGMVSEVDLRSEGSIPYTGIIILRPRSNIITRGYIKLLLISKLFFYQIELLQSGATIQHFGPTHLRQMSITLPPVSEQRHIVEGAASTLSRIGRLATKSDEIIERLKEHRQALISNGVTGKIDVRNWKPPQSDKPSTEPAEENLGYG